MPFRLSLFWEDSSVRCWEVDWQGWSKREVIVEADQTGRADERHIVAGSVGAPSISLRFWLTSDC